MNYKIYVCKKRTNVTVHLVGCIDGGLPKVGEIDRHPARLVRARIVARTFNFETADTDVVTSSCVFQPHIRADEQHSLRQYACNRAAVLRAIGTGPDRQASALLGVYRIGADNLYGLRESIRVSRWLRFFKWIGAAANDGECLLVAGTTSLGKAFPDRTIKRAQPVNDISIPCECHDTKAASGKAQTAAGDKDDDDSPYGDLSKSVFPESPQQKGRKKHIQDNPGNSRFPFNVQHRCRDQKTEKDDCEKICCRLHITLHE